MRWSRTIGRPHSNLWVFCFIVILVLCNEFSLAGRKSRTITRPPEVKSSRIINPVSSLMPEYPQIAYEAKISAVVWTRFKIDSSYGIHSVEVIYCSVDSYGFEKAAINWIETGHFIVDPKKKIDENEWWYSKLDFMHEKWNWHLRKTGQKTRISISPPASGPVQKDSTIKGFKPVEEMPKFKYKPRMEYPEKAREYGKSAKVTVRVLIGQDGSVKDVVIEDTTDPNWMWGFNETAIEGGHQCKFWPALQNGKKVNVWVSFPFEFNLGR